MFSSRLWATSARCLARANSALSSASRSAAISTSFRHSTRWYSSPSSLTRAPANATAFAGKRDSKEQPPAEIVSHSLPKCSANEKDVFIHWGDSEWSRFHNLWLRDHCRCSECYHHVTKQRLLNTFDIPNDIEPASIHPQADGLQIVWQPASQPHTSFYPWPWLRYNAYDPPRPPTQSEKVLWGSRIVQDPPTVQYDEVMASDGLGLYKWLSKIDKFGFCFVSGVPQTPEATEEVCARIGFIRETHYGKFWDFTADLARGDTAYTNLALPAHTDNTYFTDPCGIQLFHLLSHTDGSGGATLLVDGFYAASILQELHPEIYDILSRVPIPAHAAGEDSILYRTTSPVLSHDPATDALARVRWNNEDRSVLRTTRSALGEGGGRDAILRVYDALRMWNQFLTSADSEYWVQLTPGTLVAIDNHRVLHGRSAFDGKRRMCGAYIGRDEFCSRLGVLAERYAPKTGAGASRESEQQEQTRKLDREAPVRTEWSFEF